MIENPSQFQKDIFEAVADTNDSLLIEAVAGSGKTTTIVDAINFVPQGQSVCFVAFNKSIADELQRRVTRPGARCMTLHSAGWAAWRRSLVWDADSCNVANNKIFEIMRELMSWKEREKWGESTRRLVGYAKMSGIVPHDSMEDERDRATEFSCAAYRGLVEDTDEVWENICDHYGIDIEEANLNLMRKVLRRSIAQARFKCDFDDMLYMPIIAGVGFDQWDVVFVDEAQDLSGIQIEIISRMVRT